MLRGSNNNNNNNNITTASSPSSSSSPHPLGILFVIGMFILTRVVVNIMEMMKSRIKYTMDQVALHNTREDCWVVVDGEVYDITRFLRKHPPGMGIILKYAGKDVTNHFEYHTEGTKYFWRQLKIGTVVE
jgi:cytochrome b involved in lipid metabolism